MSYAVATQAIEITYEVKKSKFIAYAACASDREMAMLHLSQRQAAYPDARHHCWAYLLGNPANPNSAAMSDDGEPSGTAGKPILNVLQHKDVGDIVVIVSRYFGGIKLGAGGLVRAYSASAQQAMEQLPTVRHIPLTPVTIECDFKDEQYMRLWTQQHQGKVVNCDYLQHVSLAIEIREQDIDELTALCASVNANISKAP